MSSYRATLGLKQWVAGWALPLKTSTRRPHRGAEGLDRRRLETLNHTGLGDFDSARLFIL